MPVRRKRSTPTATPTEPHPRRSTCGLKRSPPTNSPTSATANTRFRLAPTRACSETTAVQAKPVMCSASARMARWRLGLAQQQRQHRTAERQAARANRRRSVVAASLSTRRPRQRSTPSAPWFRRCAGCAPPAPRDVTLQQLSPLPPKLRRDRCWRQPSAVLA